jgi:hypothetical protein
MGAEYVREGDTLQFNFDLAKTVASKKMASSDDAMMFIALSDALLRAVPGLSDGIADEVAQAVLDMDEDDDVDQLVQSLMQNYTEEEIESVLEVISDTLDTSAMFNYDDWVNELDELGESVPLTRSEFDSYVKNTHRVPTVMEALKWKGYTESGEPSEDSHTAKSE